ncbi:hypothetical protein SOM11_06855 [Frigoribacterium sp. CFBP9039]|uniref:hypothetical protein n=1 Tax=Frigoribacterium sp. CFBP9029 TaxID=3096541 RepID=UPI002A6B327C|nr:hypothetical protein [Frigoribacterium sp. CFBP9039]MDY0945704.1 hypothetical protein [Frigoribacterium sp. CFBP9039]
MIRPGGVLRAVVLSVVTVLAVAGCASGAGSTGEDARDAAGLTQAEVAGMSLEDEFGLAADRYSEIESVLEEAQLQVSDDAWRWNGGDVLPSAGGPGSFGEPLPGADGDNSYYFRVGRTLRPEGASGAVANLEPMSSYFDEKGWKYGTRESDTKSEVRADTGDGWWLTYTVRDNGQYSLVVYSELYWTNDAGELRLAIGKRDVTPFPEESVPGEHEPFPSWSDPVQP